MPAFAARHRSFCEPARSRREEENAMRVPMLALTATLLACATPLAASAEREAPVRVGQYVLEVVGASGELLPTFEHRGGTYVLGTLGQRYLLRVRNRSERRIEVVASVDGRDVIDGRPASPDKRGYIVDAWSDVTIDGFRLHRDAVAAFRFSSVPRSYAARMGDARDVGVIGVAVFAERPPRRAPPAYRPHPPPYPSPFPGHTEAEPQPGSGREAAPTPEAPGKPGTDSGVAAAPSPAPDASASRRRGLGTEFGEAHVSHVETVPFERARSRPETILTLRCDDRQGLLALGVDVDGWRDRDDAWLRATATPFRGSPGYAEPPPGW
jgi:hypothetical protein